MNVPKLPIHHAVLGLYQNDRETRRSAKKVIKTVGFNGVIICGVRSRETFKINREYNIDFQFINYFRSCITTLKVVRVLSLSLCMSIYYKNY